MQQKLIKTKPGEIEQIAVNNAKNRKNRREPPIEGEEEKKQSVQPENSNLSKARAIFDEHGRRDMETAFLEAVLSQNDESNFADLKI